MLKGHGALTHPGLGAVTARSLNAMQPPNPKHDQQRRQCSQFTYFFMPTSGLN
jgi:hypothetical protein